MNTNKSPLMIRYPLVFYFIFAFLFSWLILSPGVADSLGLIEFKMDGTVLTILSTLGPLLAAILVSSAGKGWEGPKQVVRSAFNWQVSWVWWLACLGLIGALMGIAQILGHLITIPGMESGTELGVEGWNLWAILILFLAGSFGEEPGWRGFALPRLQKRFKPLAATLILTLFWWVWHIPTYWTLPTAIALREQVGFIMAFSMHSGVLLALGLLCAWVFNGSKGSILMPVLLHASWNFWSMSVKQEVSTLLLPLFLVAAIIVGISTKGKLGLSTNKES